MKLFATLAAGIIAVSALAPATPSSAQPRPGIDQQHGEARRDGEVRHEERQVSRKRSYRKASYRTVCRTRNDHGRRVRRCSKVRR